MKKLYLIRHAKSVKSPLYEKDLERPLDSRGNKDAYRMALYCKENLNAPDLFLSSDSVRTMQTMDPFESCFPDTPVRKEHRIYDAPMERLEEIISATDESVNVLYVFGHNPGLQELVSKLIQNAGSFPTCSVAVFGSEGKTWKEFFEKRTMLIEFLTPKIV
ncbi:MAG TPA: histidine phosphatase family protein [Saprospiraceae bacterium]|nr:histidine phosphatase family protein [Saprospiraceae bacterium]HQW56518.1 histidine phosphatase family protein [Saprospiraceae bacterium]